MRQNDKRWGCLRKRRRRRSCYWKSIKILQQIKKTITRLHHLFSFHFIQQLPLLLLHLLLLRCCFVMDDCHHENCRYGGGGDQITGWVIVWQTNIHMPEPYPSKQLPVATTTSSTTSTSSSFVATVSFATFISPIQLDCLLRLPLGSSQSGCSACDYDATNGRTCCWWRGDGGAAVGLKWGGEMNRTKPIAAAQFNLLRWW